MAREDWQAMEADSGAGPGQTPNIVGLMTAHRRHVVHLERKIRGLMLYNPIPVAELIPMIARDLSAVLSEIRPIETRE